MPFFAERVAARVEQEPSRRCRQEEAAMKTLKGPGLFLAQFAQDTPPHNSLATIARWAKDNGYKGIQIPSWDRRFFDLDLAAASNGYCDEITGMLADVGIR